MRRKNGLRPVWQVVLIDLLVAVLILGGWFLCKAAGIEIAARRFEKSMVASAAVTPAPEEPVTSPPAVTEPLSEEVLL